MIRRCITVLAMLFLVSSCMTQAAVRAQNRQRLLGLRSGMSKAETIEIMGSEVLTTHPVKHPWILILFPPAWFLYPTLMDTITNPYRSELSVATDGTSVEIIYYYTDVKSVQDSTGYQIKDAVISDDELTPLIFEDGQLVGWGWNFLERNVERYSIELRLR